jgi:hypothetical protein
MSYNNGRQWNQNQMNFGPLELEQEYDFGAYAYSQQQLPAHSSSSLFGAFTQQQPPSQSRSSALGSHPNQTGGYVHGVYGSQSNNPSTSAPYRTNPTTFTFTAGTSTVDTNATTQKPIPNFLNSSPAATQQSFSQPSTPNSFYHSPPNNRTANVPQSKRQHTLAFKDEFNQEDPDGEIGTDQKDGNKSKLYVLINVTFSHVLITL